MKDIEAREKAAREERLAKLRSDHEAGFLYPVGPDIDLLLATIDDLRAQVARLEAANAAKDVALIESESALSWTHDCFKKDAPLELGNIALLIAVIDHVQETRDSVHTALSDTAGEGWLPVDLVWPYLWHLPSCSYRRWPGERACDCGFMEMMAKAKEAKGCQRCP